jgi:N utilization substance protein B
MVTRRKGRESALQILYQVEILAQQRKSTPASDEPNKHIGLANVSRSFASEAIQDFFVHFEAPKEVLDHTTSLVHGILLNAQRIDDLISRHSDKWRIERMALVDRNVLRIACYELLFSLDLNPGIIIDEAVEVAKRFGSDKSAAFVNGILDSIAAETRKGPGGATRKKK